MKEIERKFLLASTKEFREKAREKNRISQGYLNSDPARTVRVRIIDEVGLLTVKGAAEAGGLSRYEWEIQIPVKEARELLALCEPGIIEKFRYRIPSGVHEFEVDEFLGANKGLFLAEVELQNESERVLFPEWLGKEVTGDKRFYNSYLIHNPYSQWKQKPH